MTLASRRDKADVASSRKVNILLAVLLPLLAVNCQNTLPKESKAAGQLPTTDVPTTLAILRSGIRGVPVPPAATRVEPSTSDSETYRLPPGEPIVQLFGFYSQNMPPGLPHESLEWCGRRPIKGTVPAMQLLWRTLGSNDFISVVLTNDNSGVTITITEHQDGSAYQCN